MKKLFAYVGLAALGASSLHAQYNPTVTPEEAAKPWSLAATVRGFYDDNYLTLHNGPTKVAAVGEEFSPSASMNYTVNQTTLSLQYVFDLRDLHATDRRFFEDSSTIDTSHMFNANLKENFSERYSMQVSESFIVAQLPTVIDPTISTRPLYTEGNNIHNTGIISFDASLAPKLDLQLSYANNLYAYQQTFGDVKQGGAGAPYQSSYSALLDRMEQLATINLNWQMLNDLAWVAGYSYGHTDYTSPEPVIFDPATFVGSGTPIFSAPKDVHSASRNNDSDFIFVGANVQFTPQINGQIRAGAEYLDYYKVGKDDLGPYVDASMTWTYMKESYLQVGVKHEHSATDVVGNIITTGSNRGEPVLDADTTAAYISVNQKIAGNLTGGVLGQYQHSAFNGGSVNGQSSGEAEDFFIMGLNFTYRCNSYLSVESGYNWNKLVSDLSVRDYTRNMVYLGVRATY